MLVRSSVRTNHVAARVVVVVLVVVAVVSLSAAWWFNYQVNERRAAVTAPVPLSLTTTTPVAGESSTSAATKQKPSSPATASTLPALIVKPIVPSHIFIPKIGVNAVVAGKPSSLQWDELLGKYVESFGVPPDSDMYTTTWWKANLQGKPEPRPGDPGMAVILGHTQIGAYGVFNNLGKLQPHQVIGVSDGHTTLKFEVIVVRTGISKKDPTALQNALSGHPANARLALLTCSGHFNGSESVENTIVFAALVSVGS